MHRIHSHINTAIKIVEAYNGQEPFASFLKKFFLLQKKYGGNDRKQIAHLCYCYFRLGKGTSTQPLFGEDDLEEKILTGLFLCSRVPNEILAALKPGWNENVQLSLLEKLSSLNYHLSSVFPLKEELSKEIDYEKFSESFFIQPDLFIRIRPGKKEKIIGALDDAGVHYALLNSDCIQLNNGTKIDELIEIDKVAVVQDYNSQKIGDLFPLEIANSKLSIKVWDCCAASGGKSILLFDKNPQIQLTVSDVRESILANLKKRFAAAGITNYKNYLLDLSSKRFSFTKKFDVIICDAPCSGSGTWNRTPEQLSFFKKEKINYYAELQKKIVMNTAKSVNTGGYFIYITCSVFKKENEEVVEFITGNSALQLLSMQYLKGYEKKADTLFVALFHLL